MDKVVFNTPYLTGNEINYIIDAHQNGQLAGDGKYTKLASGLIEKITGVEKSLITHSCTAALEMAALLLNLQEGDEVIMPSYTFVSTANAVVLRGATPVFVDVDRNTFNIDPLAVKSAITSRTKAIFVVHYAGVSCDMDLLLSIVDSYGIPVIEDAAQAILSSYKEQSLGSIGALGCLSFHETKNVISGEGGALLINRPSFISRAEIIREKGTNRSRFSRGEVDKYTWVDVGSSFLPGELIAAFLYAQLQNADSITESRINNWNYYHKAFADLESEGFFRRQIIPDWCNHNAHMYYLILNSKAERAAFIKYLKAYGIYSVFHYVPLHSSPAGKKYGRASGSFLSTEIAADRLVRLPMGVSINTLYVVDVVKSFFSRKY